MFSFDDIDELKFYVHKELKRIRVLSIDDPEYGSVQYYEDHPVPMEQKSLGYMKRRHRDFLVQCGILED